MKLKKSKLIDWTLLDEKPTIKMLTSTLVLLSVPLIALMIYFTGGIKYSYSHLMYIPLVLVGSFFGKRFGIFVAIIAGLLLGPIMPLDTITGEQQVTINWIFRMCIFCVITILSGFATEFYKRDNEIIKRMSCVNQQTGIPNINSLPRQPYHYNKDTHCVITVYINNYHNLIDYFGIDVYNTLMYKVYLKLKEELTDEAKIIQSDSNRIWICDNYTTFEEKIKLLHDLLIIPYSIDGINLYLEYSLGFAKPKACNHSNMAENFQYSDMAARYAQKNNLRYYVFNEALLKNLGDFELVSSFTKAVEEGQLKLVYQPKFDIETRLPIGLEALIRWHHPKKGLIMPDQFIPLIEETQLIHLLTKFVITEAVKKIEEFNKEGLNIVISVNVSGKNLYDDTFFDKVMKLVNESNIKPNQLEIEITESVLITNPEASTILLNKFSENGFNLSLDDFGKGYSSLAYLCQFNISYLKIDKFFTQSIDKSNKVLNIVKSIIAMAHTIGAKVIAEGVEDEEILNLALKLGCEFAQGFYFARPINDEDIIEWYKQSISVTN